jgi:hypothetical protein
MDKIVFILGAPKSETSLRIQSGDIAFFKCFHQTKNVLTSRSYDENNFKIITNKSITKIQNTNIVRRKACSQNNEREYALNN